MPLNVATGELQPSQHWVIRLAFFILVGEVVSVLSRGSAASLLSRIADGRARTDMERGLENGEFSVVYQPQFDLVSGAMLAAATA